MELSMPPRVSTGFKIDDQSPEVKRRLIAGEPSPYLSRPVGSLDSERQWIAVALDELRRCQFADIRLGRDVYRYLFLTNGNISRHLQMESEGVGIRALVDGCWGFAATSDLTADGVRRCAQRAAQLAKGVALVTPKDLTVKFDTFAAEAAHIDEFHTPVGICPFSEPTENLADPLIRAAETAKSIAGIVRTQGYLPIFGRRRIYASTTGSYITSTHCMAEGMHRVIAVKDGVSEYRTIVEGNMAGGLEHYYAIDFADRTPEACSDALAKCSAKRPDNGKYDLILDGHNLALTMHESVGHPTELDRVLGFELNMAGGSFASLDKLNNFQYGSPIVNFLADGKMKYGVATQGYDDEGVECQTFPIIQEGILVGYGTSRETAHAINAERANGTCRATGWADVPITRIPNLYLQPGNHSLSLDDLIADTKDGIYMMGRDSFSIDQMRYNFQFGADMCYRVRNGKLAEPLRHVIYQGISPEFWNRCDAICDASEWQMHGFFTCGKGQPVQLAKMTHGASPSRFRQIQVGY